MRNRQQQPSIGNSNQVLPSGGVYPSTSNNIGNNIPTSGTPVNYSSPKSRASSTASDRATYVSSSQQTDGYSHSPRHSGGAKYASVQVTPSPTSKQPSYQPTEYTSVFISDQSSNENSIENDTVYENLPSPRVKLKPILSNSSRSSSIRSESSIDSSTDGRPKQNSVTFANTNDKQNHTNRTNYEIMTSLSFDNGNTEPAPMLPLKRSNTLPIRQSNGRIGNSPTRLQGLYENVISNNDVEDGRLMRTSKIRLFLLHGWSRNLSDSNGIRTHNHLVRKRTLNYLANLAKPVSLIRWLSVRLRTKLLWMRISLQSLKLQISRLFRAMSSLAFRQLRNVDSLRNSYLI